MTIFIFGYVLIIMFLWGGRRGSNPRPMEPQPIALPLSYDRHIFAIKRKLYYIFALLLQGKSAVSSNI